MAKSAFSPTLEQLQQVGTDCLPGHLGMEILSVADAQVRARMPVHQHHMAPNGFLHGGSVVALADTLCGYGTMANLPEGAVSFTTIELKANYFASVKAGAVVECVASAVHLGRSTQVWDAEVRDESNGKRLALFRCSNMVIYPKA
ncbi:PaaI family thioesterase [Oceanobacter mangrovi]|uniref:PaaI family thioesterase n=1 Tax=Oceanobacter mangrovi TaxID=2862510 RepID=UPI001C8F15D5|nr:PaaI family thioesterase [Oceanobacter mangrovi]